tara:strand:- start:1 stop:1092 length:1092 start_codon:yes stop_codon:yes gene_type:complete
MAYTTIDDPTKFFSTTLWVADNASSRSLTGFGHQPDLVWTKHRASGATNPTFTDSVRGGDKQMGTPTNAAEDSGSHGKISSFDSDGITVIDGTNATYPRLYFNSLNPFGASVGGNYVGWSWKAGGTASSNGDGSITSTVSNNSTSGISIGTYTGNGTAGATVGHGLGANPDVLIVKERGNTNSWVFSHKNLTNQSGYYMLLNTTDAQATDNFFNNTSPTSSVFSTNSTPTNRSSGTYVFYAFKEVKGYSKFGSYTGNGNADGTFVYTGFRPAWVMIKRTDGSNSWQIIDNKRNSFNLSDKLLFPDLADAESTSSGNAIDMVSNGFKPKGTGSSTNSSSATYIYMAFAEHPFVTEGTKAAGTAR